MTDKVELTKKEVNIKYCPTTLMLGDYFTKPLQGNLFRRFRDVIMGKVHINDLLLDPNFKIKERVEKVSKIVIRKSGINNRHVAPSNGHVTYADMVRNGRNEELMDERS